jgi:hypothetical protein
MSMINFRLFSTLILPLHCFVFFVSSSHFTFTHCDSDSTHYLPPPTVFFLFFSLRLPYLFCFLAWLHMILVFCFCFGRTGTSGTSSSVMGCFICSECMHKKRKYKGEVRQNVSSDSPYLFPIINVSFVLCSLMTLSLYL